MNNSPHPAPPAQQPLLLDARQAAALVGVTTRRFHAMRAELPPPIVLSDRCVRWRSADLAEYVARLAAHTGPRPEPRQLAAGRAAAAAGQAPA